jgi:hypothetical protein
MSISVVPICRLPISGEFICVVWHQRGGSDKNLSPLLAAFGLKEITEH